MEVFRRATNSRLTMGARFVAAGLWVVFGRREQIEANSDKFRAELFPGEAIDPQQFKGWLAECVKAGIFETVSVDGKWWLRKGGSFSLSNDPKRQGKRSMSPVAMTFPVQGSDQEWALRQDQVDRWRELFPGLDVVQALKGALAHVEMGARHRKTASGMMRFLVAWLNREVKYSRERVVRPTESKEGRVRGDLTGAFLSLEGES